MRDSFVFYRGFLDAIDDLDDGEQLKVFRYIAEYALNEKEPEEKGAGRAVFRSIKPQIDANNKKYQNGTKGGRPKTEKEPTNNQTKTKRKTKDNQSITKPEPNVNVNVNDNDNVNVNDNDIKNKHIVHEAHALFESLWKLYPLKLGKGQISDTAKKRILDIGYDQMERAINRYKANLERETWRKPQNGSTFFNSGYVDYLDSNYPEVEEKEPEQYGGIQWQ